MADLVGEVAVRVVADARSLDKDIERKAGKAGDKASKSFMQTWNRHQRKQQYFETLRKRAEQDAAAAAGEINKALRTGVKPVDIKPRFDSAQSLRNMDAWLSDVEKRFHKNSKNISDDMTAALHRAFEDVKKEQVGLFSNETKARAKSMATAVQAVSDAQKDAAKSADRYGALLRSAVKDAENVERALTRIEHITDRAAAHDVIGDGTVQKVREVEKEASRLGRTFDRVFDTRRGTNWLRTVRTGLNNMGHGAWSRAIFKSMSGIVGAASLTTRAIITMVEVPFKVIAATADGLGKAFDFVADRLMASSKQVTMMFGQVAESLGTAFGAISAAAGPIGQVAGAVAAVVVPLSMIVGLAGAAASAVSLLAGTMTVLGSAAGYSASGLLVLGPALLAVGAGVATAFLGGKGIVGAVSALNKALDETDPKKRAEAFEKFEKSLDPLSRSAAEFVRALEPLIVQFDAVRAFVQEKLFANMAKQVGPLSRILGIVGIAAGGIATALNNAFAEIMRVATGGRQLKLFGDLLTGLAVIVRDLSVTFGNFLLGILNFFTAVTPTAQTFSEAVRGISERFLAWTQSVGGQNAISDFMTKAYDAAVTVWNIIKELGAALGSLLATAQPQGQTFLDTLLAKAQALNDWLSVPENKEKVKEWLRAAYDFGVKLWGIVEKVGAAFLALDTPANRKFLLSIVSLIGELIDLFGKLLSAASSTLSPIIGFFTTMWTWVLKVVNAVGNLISKIGNIHFPKAPSWLSWVPGLAAGGIVAGPTHALIGEAGPEAVVPLNRPLSMIDPSVRGMAALLRGQSAAGAQAVPSNVFNTDITVNSPLADPGAVATQVVNRLAVLAGT